MECYESSESPLSSPLQQTVTRMTSSKEDLNPIGRMSLSPKQEVGESMRMSVKHLKLKLLSMGIDYSKCCERSELESLLDASEPSHQKCATTSRVRVPLSAKNSNSGSSLSPYTKSRPSTKKTKDRSAVGTPVRHSPPEERPQVAPNDAKTSEEIDGEEVATVVRQSPTGARGPVEGHVGTARLHGEARCVAAAGIRNEDELEDQLTR